MDKIDDDLPEDIRVKIVEGHSGLLLLGKMIVPRSYFAVDRIELHILNISCRQLNACCAEKAISIHKLELQTATRFKIEVFKALTVKLNEFYAVAYL